MTLRSSVKQTSPGSAPRARSPARLIFFPIFVSIAVRQKRSTTLDDPTTLPEASEAHAPLPRSRLRTFSSLRHPDFRYLWVGTLLMSGGQWIQQVTLGWLLYDLTGSAVLLGLLNGLRALPFLIASPIAGVAADRMDRKKLILVTQYVLFTTTMGMGVLVGVGFLQVWHLFVFTVITGITWAFVDPVRQTLVPALVPREDLMNAVNVFANHKFTFREFSKRRTETISGLRRRLCTSSPVWISLNLASVWLRFLVGDLQRHAERQWIIADTQSGTQSLQLPG